MCFNKLERFKKLFPVRKWNKKVCCCVVRPKVLVEKQQQQIVVEVVGLTKMSAYTQTSACAGNVRSWCVMIYVGLPS